MEVLRKGSKGDAVKILQGYLGVIQDGIFGGITEEAVKALQRENNLFPDGIVGPKTWAVLQKDEGFVLKRSRRRIDEIIVHCTASREGQDFTVEQIRKDHIARGWSDIAYHFVVTLDGKIHNGRDVDLVGSHAVGHNTHSIGVVYVGGLENAPGVPYEKLKPKDTRTDAQKKALRDLLVKLRGLYPNAKIIGHRDVSSKRCPSFDAKNEYRDI